MLREYYKEYIEKLMYDLADEGYSEIDIMYEIMSIMKSVFTPIQVLEAPWDTEKNKKEADLDSMREYMKSLDHPEEIEKAEEVPKKKIVYHIGVHHNTHHYKSISEKFCGIRVFIPGDDDSLAYIIPGNNNKSTDIYKVVATGQELTCMDYMSLFLGSQNTYAIKFELNPALSVGTLKRLYWDKIKTLDDLVTYIPHERKK